VVEFPAEPGILRLAGPPARRPVRRAAGELPIVTVL
jgi:hypothetical protein